MAFFLKRILMSSFVFGVMANVPLLAQTTDDNLFVDISFDDNVAGMNCEKLKRSWGNKGGDMLLIDNVKTYSGEGNVMLLERPESVKGTGWGVGRNLPQKPYDWLKIQMAFQLDGTATQATCALELRERYNKRLYFATLGSSRGKDPIVLIDGGKKWKTARVNHFDRKVWNRVTWYVPSVTASQWTMYLKLETYDAKTGQWVQVGKLGSMQASKVEKPFSNFRINFPAGQGPMKLRFDDLKITSMANQQMELLIQ